MTATTAVWATVFAGSVLLGQEAGQARDQVFQSFETSEAGSLPEAWTVEGTNQQGPLATWVVVEDPTAPDGGKVISLTKPNHTTNATFNLCWTRFMRLTDGSIDVSFKANGGFVDEGGGPMWRVQDKDNYYVCRANPLEANFRLYVVHDGERRQLASASLEIESETWHRIRVEHHGANIVCYLNDVKLLETTDNTIRKEGGVGFWTKADAATSFDALRLSR